jgi:hypothetical protein
MSLAMSEAFNANILGNASPEEAASNIADQLQTIIDKGG